MLVIETMVERREGVTALWMPWGSYSLSFI